MPYKSLRPCSAPGCPELVRSGRYCDQHQTEVTRKYDRERGSSTERGYGANWQKLRKMILNRSPICEDPFGLHQEYGELVQANEVDHVTPLKDGGTNEMDNLQALCRSCHSRKTAVEDGRWVGGSPSLEPRLLR